MSKISETVKFDVLPGASTDLISATFVIHDEDHTLGNALRWIITKDSEVEFCGYTIPHPSEEKIHIRIQTKGGITAIQALRNGLTNLTDIFKHIKEVFQREYHTSPHNRDCNDWTIE